MKKSSFYKIALPLLFIPVIFSSCKKIQENFLLRGLWELQGIYVDTIPDNQMNNFLPSFANGDDCCNYKLGFEQDDVVVGYYVTYDSLNYVAAGTWRLDEYNKIVFKLENYIDGEFTLTRTGNRIYKMESDNNHIKAFDGINPDLDTTYTRLELKRL